MSRPIRSIPLGFENFVATNFDILMQIWSYSGIAILFKHLRSKKAALDSLVELLGLF